MGAAVAVYSATCRVLGQYVNGNPYQVTLSAIVGLSGWLPCSRFGVSHMYKRSTHRHNCTQSRRDNTNNVFVFEISFYSAAIFFPGP